jgi:hypothetical protein
MSGSVEEEVLDSTGGYQGGTGSGTGAGDTRHAVSLMYQPERWQMMAVQLRENIRENPGIGLWIVMVATGMLIILAIAAFVTPVFKGKAKLK